MPRALAPQSLALVLVLSSPAFAQNRPTPSRAPSDPLWTAVSADVPRSTAPARGESRLYVLDEAALDRALASGPAKPGARQRQRGLTLPMPDGSLRKIQFVESSIMDPSLQERYPQIRTYSGRDTEAPDTVVRFSRTPLGLHAIVLSESGVFFVQPNKLGDTRLYVSYRYEPAAGIPFECLVVAPEELVAPAIVPSGATQRTYRLAVAATGEYTTFFGSTVPLALAGITATVNAVNAIYNRDVAVRLVLVANENDVIYTNPATDPFPLSNLNAEVQTALDGAIGDANYDVGHVFHASGFSGNAGCIACVCSSGSKGSGFSQDATPNDGDFVFLVAHEMGHQHGGRHSWTGTGCGTSQWDAPASREPGSGTTIMSYSSICGADNVLGSQVGDLYFHADSRERIVGYTGSGGGTACGTAAATGNAVPTVNGGADYTIPRGTPFVLTASGSDADDPGSALTYVWEQFDVAPAQAALNTVDDGVIPLLRSRPPSSSPARTFPQFSDLLAGSANLFPNKLGEQLPSTDRGLKFRVTVRDNRASVGAANDDEVQLTVSGSAFQVTAPSLGNPLECGVSDTVQWTVGGGSIAPTVDIRLSTNGGASFPTLLAAGTANDGSEPVSVPATLSGSARVRIDSVGNIFFNISSPTDIVDTLDPTAICPADATVECTSPGGTPAGHPSLASFFAGFSSTDACDAAPSLANDAPSFFGVGTTTPVTSTATDDSGNEDTCQANVTVQDTLPPSIVCPADITVECTGNCGIDKGDPQLAPFFAGARASDVCDPVLTISNNAPAFLPLGNTPVTFTTSDDSGNLAQCSATIHVVDTRPPQIAVTVTPSTLWPPNHKLVAITASVAVSDVCDPNVTFKLVSITSDEPDDDEGDGNTTNDIQEATPGTPDVLFKLRAERSGQGDGRVYTIVYEAADNSGNTAQAVAYVKVPKSQGN